MGDFDFLGTWEFWISAVIVGLLVNLLAAAIWKFAPKILAKVSDRWAERNETARREREQRIERLMESAENRTEFQFRILWFLLLGIQILLLAILFAILALIPSDLLSWPFSFQTQVPSLVLMAVALIISLFPFNESRRLFRLLEETKKRLLKEDEPAAEHDDD